MEFTTIASQLLSDNVPLVFGLTEADEQVLYNAVDDINDRNYASITIDINNFYVVTQKDGKIVEVNDGKVTILGDGSIDVTCDIDGAQYKVTLFIMNGTDISAEANVKLDGVLDDSLTRDPSYASLVNQLNTNV